LDEDMRLYAGIAEFGPSRWRQVAERVGSRDHMQVRDRWSNHLRPEVNQAEWTEEEDALILLRVRERGKVRRMRAARPRPRAPSSCARRLTLALLHCPPGAARPRPRTRPLARPPALGRQKWSAIVMYFDRRSAHSIKNRYHLLIRRCGVDSPTLDHSDFGQSSPGDRLGAATPLPNSAAAAPPSGRPIAAPAAAGPAGRTPPAPLPSLASKPLKRKSVSPLFEGVAPSPPKITRAAHAGVIGTPLGFTVAAVGVPLFACAPMQWISYVPLLSAPTLCSTDRLTQMTMRMPVCAQPTTPAYEVVAAVLPASSLPPLPPHAAHLAAAGKAGGCWAPPRPAQPARAPHRARDDACNWLLDVHDALACALESADGPSILL
jgi:hypothetical protein